MVPISPSVANAPLPAYDLLAMVRESCVRAIRATTPWPGSESVHAARQALKRARAALRLLEDAGVRGAKARRRELAACARELSPLRDAAVTAWLAAVLAKKLKKRPGRAALVLARTKRPVHSAAWWHAWRRRLGRVVQNLDRLGEASPPPGALEQCFARSVRRVKRRARAAVSADPAAVHAWRKALVILREQVLTGRPLIGRANDRLYARLRKLTGRLGEATDCRVLLAAIARHPWPDELARAAGELATAVRRRHGRACKRARRFWQGLSGLTLTDEP